MEQRTTENREASVPARIVRAITSLYFDLQNAKTANVQLARARLNFFGRFVPVAGGVDVQSTEVAGLDAEWLTPEDAPADRAILYLHGGAYVVGSCDSHRHLVSHIARASGVRALLPEYGLAPENRFPGPIDDVVHVYRALLDDGFDPAQLLIAGDSAGGGLAVATLLTLRDEGLPMPRAAFLLSPWLDLTASGETMESRSEQDPWFRADDIREIARHYCDDDQRTDPRVSPVYADMHGMPPMHIQVGDDEILLSDATRLADNLRAAAVDVSVDVWQDMWHVFQAFLLVVPEAREAVQRMGEAMREALEEK